MTLEQKKLEKFEMMENHKNCSNYKTACEECYKKFKDWQKKENLLNKIASEISEKRGEIIDSFLKTFVASQTLGMPKEDIKEFMKSIELVERMISGNEIGYSFEIQPKTLKTEQKLINEWEKEFDKRFDPSLLHNRIGKYYFMDVQKSIKRFIQKMLTAQKCKIYEDLKKITEIDMGKGYKNNVIDAYPKIKEYFTPQNND